MGRKRTDPTTYLAGWPEALVIKAGESERQRWRSFEARGASDIALFRTPIFGLSLQVERELHTHLWNRMPRAFIRAELAEPLLGNRGGGYLECYQAITRADYLDAWNECLSIMLKHRGSATTPCNASPNARPECTDGRTNEPTKTVAHVTSRASLTDTCAHVQDFDDLKKRTAERKPEPTRELRDPAQVINAHLEESA